VAKDGEVIAGGIYTQAGGVVQYHLGASATEHLQLNPVKVMFDHATRWAKRRGNQWLHLGGGVGGADDSLFHFKAGFSPLRCTFATWRLIVDRAAYEQLAAEGEANGEHSSYFPAYRAGEAASAPPER
jgi:lipid II:glycine glycyltransferase (peptidoglycan interpeptide bridge formation enzyme)